LLSLSLFSPSFIDPYTLPSSPSFLDPATFCSYLLYVFLCSHCLGRLIFGFRRHALRHHSSSLPALISPFPSLLRRRNRMEFILNILGDCGLRLQDFQAITALSRHVHGFNFTIDQVYISTLLSLAAILRPVPYSEHRLQHHSPRSHARAVSRFTTYRLGLSFSLGLDCLKGLMSVRFNVFKHVPNPGLNPYSCIVSSERLELMPKRLIPFLVCHISCSSAPSIPPTRLTELPELPSLHALSKSWKHANKAS